MNYYQMAKFLASQIQNFTNPDIGTEVEGIALTSSDAQGH